MQGHAAGAPFDRAVITAATWDLPAVLFGQVADGGRILVPVELRDGSGCEVTVLRRQGAVLVAEQAVSGWFVPLLGPGQDRSAACLRLGALPFWDEVCGAPSVRCALTLGVSPGDGAGLIAAQLQGFMGRAAPGMPTTAAPPGEHATPWRPVPPGRQPMRPFGLVDEAERSVALWDGGELVGYGGRAAAVRLARAYARWAKLGLPGMGAFGLEIHRTDAAPASGGDCWVEPRGATVLAWRLKPGVARWQDLLGSGEQRLSGPLATEV